MVRKYFIFYVHNKCLIWSFMQINFGPFFLVFVVSLLLFCIITANSQWGKILFEDAFLLPVSYFSCTFKCLKVRIRATTRSKTGKTAALPGFYGIERSSSSGMACQWFGHHYCSLACPKSMVAAPNLSLVCFINFFWKRRCMKIRMLP